MTYDTTRILDARLPITVAELQLDTCAYEYGKSVTNLFTYSEQFDHANWAKTNTTITANNATAPDGKLTADKLIATSGTSARQVLQNISIISGRVYTQSAYAKKGEYKYLQIAPSTGFASDYLNFNLETGTIASGTATGNIEDVGDGWYRCSVTATATSTTSGRMIISFAPTDITRLASYAGDGVSGLYIFGGQLVEGNKSGHYVKTEATSLTGSCDATDAKANLLTYSEQFDNVAWSKSELTAPISTYKAPDGGDSNKLLPSVTSGVVHHISQNANVTNGQTYTQSIYATEREYRYLQLAPSTGFASEYQNFDLANGVLAGGTSGIIAGIEPAGDGWYRCWITVTATSTVSGRILILPYNTDAARLDAYTGDGASGINIWGAQLVKGLKAGIYYKTEATAFSGTVGTECYNTFLTCQDTANFTKHLKTYRFYQPVSNWPIGQTGYPCIKGQPTFTPCQIDPKGSLGKRGVVSFKCEDFADDDLVTDEYQSTRSYNPEIQGTFFRKLKARSPYYKGRLMKVRQGYINDTFSFNDFENRLYVIESIDIDQNGMVTITGKDLLKLAEDKKSVAPVASSGTLSAAMTAGQTTAVLQAGEGTDYDTDPYTGSAISGSILGYALIGDELASFTGISTDTITGLTRGLQGTTAETHDIDDAVQLCLHFEAVNVVDIIHYLLKTGAGIDETYLPYDAGLGTPTGTNDEWDTQKASWLSGNVLTHTVIDPTGVTKLVERICKQNLIYMWFHERDQEVKLRAIAPTFRNELPPTLSEDSHLIADSIKTKDMDKNRISQIWVYYDIVDVTGDRDKADNYKKLKVTVDTDSENVNAYSEKAIKVIYADWLGSANEGLILTLAGRLLSRYADRPENITFKVDTKDADFWTGELALLDTFNFQDTDGSNKLKKVQMMKVKDDHDKQIIEVEAESWDYSDNRYGFVTPDSMGNYTAETDLNQQSYGFISQNDGLYTNSDIGHLIA